MTKASVLAILCMLPVAGCSIFAPRADDVREIAPNTFELAKKGTLVERRGSELRLQLFARGLAFCEARGRGFSLLDDASQDASDGDQETTGTFASAIIHFNCL